MVRIIPIRTFVSRRT
uniref:Uncharacterized protein n=1 Tax=Romanomermis culicivorax TaxID=13658 RepID=A0A915K706_ROMCU